MEATALSVGKSVLDGALGYAKSAFAEEVALQLGIQRDQAFVADELEMMRSFMMVAHEERDDNKVVKTWVKQVRDTAYDVEDSLLDFAVRLKKPSRWNFLRTLLERRRIAKHMKELRMKVEDVSQRNVRYQLIKGSCSKAAAAPAEKSSIIATAVFGVDDARHAAKQDNQRDDLVKLISEDEGPEVIAVWGTSGDIGQTSLIREAYEHPAVCSKFPVRAWVRVMHPFSLKGFIQSIVNQIYACSAKGLDDLLEAENIEQDIAKKFNGYVHNKNCLFVLNDLSTIEQWDQIKICFKKGIRIVVSTTQVEVASLCAGPKSKASELKQLSADQTLYAFYIKASKNIKDSKKQAFISDASTSANDHTVAPGDIIEDQLNDADGKKVFRKSITRTMTSAGALTESQLIRREKQVAHIDQLIAKKRDSHQVISVWGMGGVGKTTLVDCVYQSQKLSSKFDKCAFVTIMRPFDIGEFLYILVKRLNESPSTKEELIRSSKKTTTMGVEPLTWELASLLEMKSCLIVLDDLWSTTEWDLIQPWFRQMKRTSRIIVTTREEKIAKYCSDQPENIYNLEVLEYEVALDLFSEKVFGKATILFEQYPELVEEAKRILRKCGGLPLAIVTIGGFLADQPKNQMEWRKLNENISAELETSPELGKIRTILEKSYDGLPYHLKSCFLYMSIFPEDHIICRRRLVCRWAAEGYSTGTHGKSANEIADSYFTELKNRSMILPSQQSVFSRKSIDSCKVHDLIRDIAISKSTEENLVLTLEEGCSMNSHGAIRHLAISSNWKGGQSEFESVVDVSPIRSLSVFGQWRPFYISEKMRFLRVLDLEGTKGLVSHHLDHIGKLLHLRYLSLRRCKDIELLPDSLGNLRQLQTLDIRDTDIIALPKTITKLQKLQYINAAWKSDIVHDDSESLTTRFSEFLGSCPRLCASCCVPSLLDMGLSRRGACTFACCIAFPATMQGLLDIESRLPIESSVMVPRGLRKLRDLHTLKDVHVGRGNVVLQDIERLTGLRKLGLTGINKKNEPAFCSALSGLSRLESLSVRSSAGKPGLCGCLDRISSPPPNLQSLKLYGNLETLPEWIKELQHLVKLKLVDTRLSDNHSALKFLGNLPKLDILVLSGQWIEGDVLHFQSPQTENAFGNLTVLRLAYRIIKSSEFWMKSVKFDVGVMPKLELLQLQLHGLRIRDDFDISGLEVLPSINEVQFRATISVDYWKRKIREEMDQEKSRKFREYKNKLREQLDKNPNRPVLTWN